MLLSNVNTGSLPGTKLLKKLCVFLTCAMFFVAKFLPALLMFFLFMTNALVNASESAVLVLLRWPYCRIDSFESMLITSGRTYIH